MTDRLSKMSSSLPKRRLSRLSRSGSTESNDIPSELNKAKRKLKKPKERWLLTRKTWRYMADAGRKLIPDGAQNRVEDVPKIEAYFQEVCKREPRFLLWRKNSYPGALAFRRKHKERRKGGSCRKASSADEVDDIRPERPKDLALYPSTSGGRFDIQKMKYDFLNSPSPSSPRSFLKNKETFPPKLEDKDEGSEERQLVYMLEKYLAISEEQEDSQKPETAARNEFDYQQLVDKLQRHLTLISSNIPYQAQTNIPIKREGVHFEGDHVQKSLSETLSRYFSHSPNRDRVISDLLTNRKALQKLYFDLRQTKGFRGRRDYPTPKPVSAFDQSILRNTKPRMDMQDYKKIVPPPLIEIQGESIELEPIFINSGTQTYALTVEELTKIDEDYKKLQAEKEDDERDMRPGHRRRSSVDNDDVSQSVSDTIKRYLRMARKKSTDPEKADRFKRVNYDKNLRNIKAKGEITKPGDDDGLSKGSQTNDEWILVYRDLKFREFTDELIDSRQSSARSSFDASVILDDNKSLASSPTKSGSHSFLSNLLHMKYGNDKSVPSGGVQGAAMQKSKSSSSVGYHGSRLMAKTIFKRSKSQSRSAQPQACSWMPKCRCTWQNLNGKEVSLNDTTLQQLSEIERKVLQKVAITKLEALNIGVPVKIPTETIGTGVKKRRAYILKRKALTTSIFDTKNKDPEKEKGTSTGLVFGIPLSQCVENDRISRMGGSTASSLRGRAGESSGDETQQQRIGRVGSRASFSSLIDAATRADERGSCESLMSRDPMAGSVPGLLDTISCEFAGDIIVPDSLENPTIPNLVSECIRHLESNGLHTVGVFRNSGSKKRIRELREEFDSGKESILSNQICPHDVATLFKEYLRVLPDPLLCRELYHAFVQTQRIRNRRLQLEALQYLVQILPCVNRDTLHAILVFLNNVANNSMDQTNVHGKQLLGNKMDASNLATVFAPNILHAIKPGKEGGDRPDDRINVINVIRAMIDNCSSLFHVSAELMDEVYIEMLDSYPEDLNLLLNKMELATSYADESQDESSPISVNMEGHIEGLIQKLQYDTEPKKTYSREECLHESAATGGPNVGMRLKKERIRERSLKKRRDHSGIRKHEDDSNSSTSSIQVLGRQNQQSYSKTRSSSLESSSSLPVDNSEMTRVLRISDEQGDSRRKSTPYVLDSSGVITASLLIPVQQTNLALNVEENDIPYIEDGMYTYSIDGRQQMTIGTLKSPTAPPRRRQRSISGSDSSVASIQPVTGSINLIQGYDSAIGSSVTYSSPHHNTTPSSLSSSIADASGICSSPPSWASTPPTSPDSQNTSVNYIPDDIQAPGRYSKLKLSKEAPILQKVSFTSTSEVQKAAGKAAEIQRAGKPADIRRDSPFRKKSLDAQKLISTASYVAADSHSSLGKVNPCITSIGNAVLRSRTADFERITRTSTETKTTTTTTLSDKKKYTKRRYTDSRHQTQHIPDSKSLLEAAPKKDDTSNVAQTVYKRRELISSVAPR